MPVQEIITTNKKGERVVTAASTPLKNARITLANLETMNDEELVRGLLDLWKFKNKQFPPGLEYKLSARGTSLLAILQVIEEGKSSSSNSPEVKKK